MLEHISEWDDPGMTECGDGEAEEEEECLLPREHYQFFPDEVRSQLPALYSTEGEPDPLMRVKFFTPDSGWTWYASEYDGEDIFFGYVVGFDQELGYFSLAELQAARGPFGLPIERDIHFQPTRLLVVKGWHARAS